MTNEEKQILLKDLCARLPYGVKLYHEDDYGDLIGELESINIGDDECVIWNYNGTDTDIFDIEICKPYLRPMSSMTEDEEDEFEIKIRGSLVSYFDWLNAHHFDYRGLIEKGLAIEAPEGMYNFK